MIAQDRTEPTEIVEQHNFYTRQQRQGENTSTFVSELGTIAISCNFGEMYKKMLKDRLVCGVQDDRIERRLLVEIKLDFKKALEMAITTEAAFKNVREIWEKLHLRGQTVPLSTESSKGQAWLVILATDVGKLDISKRLAGQLKEQLTNPQLPIKIKTIQDEPVEYLLAVRSSSPTHKPIT